MRNINLHKQTYNIFRYVALLVFTVALAGCGEDSIYGESAVVDETTAASLTISTDKVTVLSDGSDSATITVVALNSSNAAVTGATISFATTGGTLSASTATTDENGEATITFTAGLSDPTNQTVAITASSGAAATASIPVEVTGSTVTISSSSSNLAIGGADTATLTITALNAAGTGVYNTPVTVTIDGTASTGAASFSIPGGGNTDTQGQWEVDLTGTSSGSVRVIATALGATATSDFVVDSAAGSLLITSPTSGTTARINVAKTVTISVPSGVTDLTLVSSLGTWSNGSNVQSLTGLSAGNVNEQLTSNTIGTSTISVSDSSNPSVSDTIQLVFVDQVVDSTSQVSLQASPTTVQPSIGTSQNTSSLIATVTSAAGTPIAGAMVTFSISNSTGSGEYISPPVAYTDAFGKATSSFYSGSESTIADGLVVTASLWETANPANLADSSTVNIIVGGTAGSITIGASTKLSSINSDTAYSLPISLQVTDSGGNPSANTTVYLSLWPEKYALGYWVCEPEAGLYQSVILGNEDDNPTLPDYAKNLILDPGEDVSGDGTLTPPNSAAGSIPSFVETDPNGIATFELTYLKANAGFIYNALTATTLVQGTETSATRRFWLGATESDIEGCYLGESPYNTHWPYLSTSVASPVVSTSATTTITATLTDTDGSLMSGETITASIVVQGSGGPTIDGPHTTDSNGQVVFTYTAGGQAGTDTVLVSYTAAPGVVISEYVFITVE